MATKTTPFRFEPEILQMADELAAHDTMGGLGPTVSRADAIRSAIREAHAARLPLMRANEDAWANLTEIAAGPASLLTLTGTGAGDLGADGVWSDLKVTAQLNQHAVDLPLIAAASPDSSLSNVYLTDRDDQARILLGPLSRRESDQPSWYDNRLFRIAEELGIEASS